MSNTVVIEPSRSYFSRALWDQHNVIVLGGALLFALSLASPMPLALAAIAEALWLTLAPNLRIYRAWVDRVDARAEREQEARDFAASPALADPTLASRFAGLSRVSDELYELATRRGELPAELTLFRHELGRLRAMFLDFGHTQQRLLRRVSELRASELSRELEQLKQDFAAERDLEARMGLRNAIQAVQSESQRQAHWLVQLKEVDSKLDMLEEGASYLKSLVLNSVELEQLRREIEGLLSEVGRPPKLEFGGENAAPNSTRTDPGMELTARRQTLAPSSKR